MGLDVFRPTHEWFFEVSVGSKSSEGVLRTCSIDKDVCVRVWSWWSEVSCPPPRACNSGFSSITPSASSLCCPLTPLILSHPASATFLNQTSCLLFFVVVSSMPLNTGLLMNFFSYPWLSFIILVFYLGPCISFVCLFIFPCLSPFSLPVSAIAIVLISLYFSSRWVPLWLSSVCSALPRPPPVVMIYECSYSRYVCLTPIKEQTFSSSFPYGLFTDPNCQLHYSQEQFK